MTCHGYYVSPNFVIVIQIYATCSLSDDNVALYIMQLERQFPSSRHLDGYLQLHISLPASMMFFSFIILALCALMICFHIFRGE